MADGVEIPYKPPMKRARMIEKLHERTGVDRTSVAALPDGPLQDYFQRSVSPALTRFQYNAGLGLIAIGSFCCASGGIILGGSLIYAAMTIAQSLNDKRGQNEAIRNEIVAAKPLQI